jgi:hypothetical protein
LRIFTNISFLFTAILLVSLSACEKSEKLYPAPVVPKGIQTATFAMGENYENQLWFEFSTQRTWSNPFGIWDIGFSCSENNEIIINSGRHGSYGAIHYDNADFGDITTVDQAREKWHYDNPNGAPDSLAFSSWYLPGGSGKITGKDRLYILNRGADSLGNKKFIKLKIVGREGGVYHFQWSLLEDSIPTNDIYLRINTNYNYVYYNFTLEKEVYNEPIDKECWDLLFTTYKEEVKDDVTQKYYPYILRGVLINPNKVRVCELNNKIAFEQIDLEFAQTQNYSPFRNEIGYDWKIWNLSANKYTVDQNKIYLIQDTKGNFFKLKFVDFYDDQGRKGFPKLAWELLK